MDILRAGNAEIIISMRAMFKSIADSAKDYFLRQSSKLNTAMKREDGYTYEVYQVDYFSYSLEYVEMLSFYHSVYSLSHLEDNSIETELQGVAKLFWKKKVKPSAVEGRTTFTQVLLNDKRDNSKISVIPAVSTDINSKTFNVGTFTNAFRTYGLLTSDRIRLHDDLSQRFNLPTLNLPT